MLLAACGTSGTGAKQGSTVLWLGAHVGGDFTKALSPYNPTVNEGIDGMVYETLLYFNRNNGQITPWLASSYQFSPDNTQLTFTTRSGVQWSDGQPFTANDVAFTFNMMKQYPAADANGLWSTYLSSVTATDDHTVVVTFKKAYPPMLWFVGGQTWIVPQHIFASAGDPTKFANDPPVGTGPFSLKSFSAQLLDYARNPKYWQADKVLVQEIKYPAVKDNNTMQLKLMAGQIDWGSFFAPDLQSTYVSKDPTHNHFWMAPVALTMIYVNLQKYPFNQLVVRQAISYALDRKQMSDQAESGYEAVASPTGILPGFSADLAPQYASSQFTQDPSKSTSLLDGAGFKKGTDGIYVDPHGNRMSYTIDVVAGWTDWDQICDIISQNLKAVGIEVKVNQLSFDDYAAIRSNGKYDMFMGGSFPGPTPYYMLNTLLNSANLAPNGFNWERWNDPQTDQYLQAYASTTDATQQLQALQGVETVMATQQPTILLLDAADWYEYSTKNWTGWPDQNNTYALPATYEAPDNEVTIMHLKPAP
jgi:peptide/nickel transport system substrate-binding protein